MYLLPLYVLGVIVSVDLHWQ